MVAIVISFIAVIASFWAIRVSYDVASRYDLPIEPQLSYSLGGGIEEIKGKGYFTFSSELMSRMDKEKKGDKIIFCVTNSGQKNPGTVIVESVGDWFQTGSFQFIHGEIPSIGEGMGITVIVQKYQKKNR